MVFPLSNLGFARSIVLFTFGNDGKSGCVVDRKLFREGEER